MTPKAKLHRESIEKRNRNWKCGSNSLYYTFLRTYRVLGRTQCYNTLVSVSKSMHEDVPPRQGAATCPCDHFHQAIHCSLTPKIRGGGRNFIRVLCLLLSLLPILPKKKYPVLISSNLSYAHDAGDVQTRYLLSSIPTNIITDRNAMQHQHDLRSPLLWV